MAGITIFVDKINASRTLDIVYELRSMGLEQPTDFYFKFIHKEDTWAGDNIDPYGAEFTFFEDKWATWFRLKYL